MSPNLFCALYERSNPPCNLASSGANLLGDYEAAIQAYTMSLDAQRDAKPFFERAQAARALGLFGAARGDYLKAADLFVKV